MDPIAVLMSEHRLIERVLDALERATDHFAGAGAVRPAFFTDAVGFLSGFADGRHHHKEEDLLFPAMVRAGLPVEAGPIAVMLDEHGQGRRLVAAIREAASRVAAGDRSGSAALVLASRSYIALLRDHIAKEDQVLFPMSTQLLSAEASTILAREFARALAEEGPDRGPGGFQDLADRLTAEAAGLAAAGVGGGAG